MLPLINKLIEMARQPGASWDVVLRGVQAVQAGIAGMTTVLKKSEIKPLLQFLLKALECPRPII